VFSLAAIKYRSVLAKFGGPIERLTIGLFNGTKFYQANAYLVQGLRPKAKRNLYGNCDGTGDSKFALVARQKAISEALERWAHRQMWNGVDRKQFGFDIDPSSCGMAAFPGLLKRTARIPARLESIERFALISWWDGRIGVSPLPRLPNRIESFRLEQPISDTEVVVVFRLSEIGHVSYGHAAGRTVAEAQEKAIIELMRTDFILTRHKQLGHSNDVAYFFEQRCLYFASPEGHQKFLQKVATPPTKPALPWKPVFDGEIPGPWSKYATVWRVAVPMPTPEYLDPKITNFFFW